MINASYGSQPIKNEQTPFDGLIEHNQQDQGKYVSLVDLQEFIFNTCNVEDNTIFIDFHNYLQFLARQRELNRHPLSDEDIEQLSIDNDCRNNYEVRGFVLGYKIGANFAKQPLESQVVELLGLTKCKNVLEVVALFERIQKNSHR